MSASTLSSFGVLPAGYNELEYATIPISSAKPKDAVVLPNVQWKQVRSIYCRYATTATTATSGYMLFSATASLTAAGNTTPWVALSGTAASGSNVGLNPSGATATLVKTPGDSYNRDGTVHEFTINIANNSASLSSSSYFQFGGGWSDTYWNGTTDFYELVLYGSDENEVAHLVPCVEKSTQTVGFYDTVAGAFRTKMLPSWDDFIAGPLASKSIFVTGEPAEIGVATPPYGAFSVPMAEIEEPIAFSLAGGDPYCSADGASRGYFQSATCRFEGGGSFTNTIASFSLKATNDLFVTWNFTNVEYRLVANADEGGVVSDGGAGAAAVTNWVVSGGTQAVIAVASAGYRFGAWSGDVPDGADIHATSLALPADRARTVRANFLSNSDVPPVAFDSGSYIKENLVVHLDGKDNAGFGVHDNSATVWKDLSGHGNDLVNLVNPSYVWGWNASGYTNLDYKANGTFTNGVNINTRFKPAVTNLTIDVRNMTVEGDFICVNEQSRSTSKNTYGNGYLFYVPEIGYSYSEGTALRIEGNNQLQVLGPAATTSAGRDVNSSHNTPHSAIYTKLTSKLWEESYGWKSSTGTTPSYGGAHYSGSVYFLNKNGVSYYRGGCHSLRLYNRALTDWEAEWNGFVDTVRYHDVVPDTTHVVHTYCSIPANYGTPDTPYGTSTLDDCATVSYSAAPILTTSVDDGARIADVNLGTGIRAKFLGWTLHRGNSVVTGSTEAATVVLTCVKSRFAWTFERQVRMNISAVSGGQVSISGGTPSQSSIYWAKEDENATLSLVATAADDNHVFGCWAGDVGTVDVTSPAIDLPTDVARNVSAVFYEKTHTPVTLNWKPGVTSGDFNDPTCWAEGLAPQAGDMLYITNKVTSAVTIVLGASTPRFGKLVIGNSSKTTTLKQTGWSSCLVADEVVIAQGGVVTHAGPYKTAEEASRVWIQAGALTVEQGGKILADGVGYAGNEKGNGVQGYGPAWWPGVKSHPSIAPIYAGINVGGQGYSAPYFAAYGDPVSPSLPGSGGVSATHHAGGAIRIEVSGTLTVDGLVSANPISGGTGTGGAIWISCDKVTGSGTVQANAKNCSAATTTQGYYAGGAGRVAVHYNPASQALATGCTVRFEALASVHRYNAIDAGDYDAEPGKKVFQSIDMAWGEEQLVLQGMGSLYFTDGTILRGAGYQTSGWKFGGELVTGAPIGTLVFNSPITFDKCQLVVRDPGLTVTANAGLGVFGAGYYARREMGVVFSNATVTVNGPLTLAGSRFGVRDGTLVVNGNVTLTNAVFSKTTPYLGGELVAFAGPTNATSQYGAEVTVNGNCKIGTGGVLHVECEPKNGAIVKVRVNGRMTVDEGGRVDSDMGGYLAGPGSGNYYQPGPSHGGRGSGETASKLKPVYGNTEEPVTPGSGGGQTYSKTGYSRGGGVVLLEVSKTLTLDGVISADSNRKWANNYLTPGSGGSVNIRATHLTGTGRVSASGGVSNGYGLKIKSSNVITNLSAGAGGRVAIRTRRDGYSWSSESAAEKEARAVALPGPRAPLNAAQTGTDYSNASFPDPLVYDAEPGTVYWDWLPMPMMILVR